MYIASKGRAGKISALTIVSVGRLWRLGEIIEVIKRLVEVIRATSEIDKTISFRSILDGRN
jgi:hypothetical protein